MSARGPWQAVGLIAVVLAACYEPSFAPCTIQCTTTCPGDLECVAGTCAPAGGTCELEGAARRTAGGAHHACGIVGGALYCWGSNASGQLAQPVPAPGTDPALATTLVDPPVPGTWISVAAGDAHTCALLAPAAGGVDELYCWGASGDGQLGDVAVDSTPFRGPARPADTRWVGLALGARHGCAIVEDAALARRIVCWGDNELEQLGTAAPVDQPTPVAVAGLPPTARWVSIDAGSSHTCAIDATASLYCWGSDALGQLGRTGTSRAAGQVPGSWRAVTAGGDRTCAIATSGEVSCWGDNADGQLGTASMDPSVDVPAVVGDLGASATWDALDAGPRATCGVIDGVAYCWGAGHPQAGLDTLASGQATPTDPVLGIAPAFVAEVAVTDVAACALVEDGGAVELRCWGDSPFGELGDGTRTIEWAPVQITSAQATAWVRVRAGVDRTCAVYVSGGSYATQCWGQNAAGQSAPSTATDHVTTPAPLDTPGALQPWVAVGRRHTCTLVRIPAANPEVRCWGDDTLHQRAGNPAGQPIALGIGTNATIAADLDATCATGDATGIPNCWGTLDPGHQLLSPTPLPNAIPLRPATVLWGHQSGCGIDPAGMVNRVKCFGTEERGELGDGSPMSAGTYFQPADTTIVAAVTSQGPGQTRCLWTGFDVMCWGDNRRAQASPAMAADALAQPMTTVSVTGVTELATGLTHSCMVATSAIQCWGGFDVGQRADAQSTAPAPIAHPAASTWAAVSAGGEHTCAIDAIGRLYCWGRNTFGQIGNGRSARASASPVMLP